MGKMKQTRKERRSWLKFGIKAIPALVLSISLMNVLLINSYQGETITKQRINYETGIVLSSFIDAIILNPLLHNDEFSTKFCDPIFESLIEKDFGGNDVPWLAESWEISPDLLDYTFYLRDDVYWHNGVKFSAFDVAFTFDRIFDPRTDTTMTGNLQLWMWRMASTLSLTTQQLFFTPHM